MSAAGAADTNEKDNLSITKSIIGDGSRPLSKLFKGVSYNLVTAVNLSGEFIRENTSLIKEIETGVFSFPQDPTVTSNFTACGIWAFGLHIYMVYRNEAEKNLKAQAEIKTIMKFFNTLSLKIERLAMEAIKFARVMDEFHEHLSVFTVEMQSLGFSIKFHSEQEDEALDEHNVDIGSGLVLSKTHAKETSAPLYVYAVNYKDNTVTFDDVTKFSVKAQNQISGVLLREIQSNLIQLEKALPRLITNIKNEKIRPNDPHITSVYYLMDQIIKFFHRSPETTHDHEKGYTWAMERVVINTTSFIRRIYKLLRSIIEIRDTLELTYTFLGLVPIVRGSKYYQAYVPSRTTMRQGFWNLICGCRCTAGAAARRLNYLYTPSMFMRAPFRKILKQHFLPVASNLYPDARFSITMEPVWPLIGDKEVIGKRWFKDDAYMVTGDTFKLNEFPHPKPVSAKEQAKAKAQVAQAKKKASK